MFQVMKAKYIVLFLFHFTKFIDRIVAIILSSHHINLYGSGIVTLYIPGSLIAGYGVLFCLSCKFFG